MKVDWSTLRDSSNQNNDWITNQLLMFGLSSIRNQIIEICFTFEHIIRNKLAWTAYIYKPRSIIDNHLCSHRRNWTSNSYTLF